MPLKTCKLSALLRRVTWNKLIGEEIIETSCFCCYVNIITRSNFHYGHVSEKYGGKQTMENMNGLKLICQMCDSAINKCVTTNENIMKLWKR